jgi:hypothetical protein
MTTDPFRLFPAIPEIDFITIFEGFNNIKTLKDGNERRCLSYMRAGSPAPHGVQGEGRGPLVFIGIVP